MQLRLPGAARALALTLGLIVPLACAAVVRDVPDPRPQVTAATFPDAQPAENAGGRRAAFVPGELLVTFKAAASAQTSRSAVGALGDELGAVLESRLSTAKVRLDSGRSVPDAVRAYSADPRVLHAQPNYIYRAAATPNDPDFGELWGLENTGQTVNGTAGTADRDIAAPQAWDLVTDCSGVRVAVLDTGINYTHADLAGNMWTGPTANRGWDFVDSSGDDDPLPEGGAHHGTHVAGTIAAVGDNGQGVTGVCWQAEIMAVRVLDASGVGTSARIVEGINYAVDNGADVINMSLSGGAGAAEEDALTRARDNGALVVAAAGNEGIDVDPDANPVFPCSFELDNIVCVAALDQDYGLAGFSNFGDTAVDIGAPGVNTYSTFPGPVVPDDFSTWTLDASWAVDTCAAGSLLVNPANWCSSSDSYENDLDARAVRSFDLSSSIGAGYKLSLDLALNDSGDAFRLRHEAGSTDPFGTGSIDVEVNEAFSTGGFAAVPRRSLADCVGQNCSIGARLTSDASGAAEGVAAASFELHEVVDSATQKAFLAGTSMAAPHVSGVAALAWSAFPDKGYADIRSALLESGDAVMALDSRTTTGRAVNALEAVKAANDPPEAPDQSAMTARDASVDVVIEATDPNGHPVSFAVSQRPRHGSVNLSGDTATYTPDAGFEGFDSFAVEVSDPFAGASTSAVDVAVGDAAALPVIFDEKDENGGGAIGWIFLAAGALGLLCRSRSLA